MKNAGTVLGVITAAVVFILLAVAIVTWPSMIMFGVVHSYWPVLPAFGFWETLGVIVLVQLVTAKTYVKES
jgi:hypothetical protein